MGLDVYLYRCKDRATAKVQSEAYEAARDALRTEKFCGKWPHEQASDAVKDQQRTAEQALADEHNCEPDGESKLIERVEEQNSATDKEHLFKIGYCRSSYNEGGLNSLMRKLGLATLYDIFGVPDQDHEYEVMPDWQASMERCEDAIAKLEAHAASPSGKYHIMKLRGNPFVAFGGLPKDEQAARTVFIEVLKNHLANPSPFGGSFSNGTGEYMLEGLKFVAFIHGSDRNLFSPGMSTCVYGVYEAPDLLDWYVKALKITAETISYVLASGHPEEFYLGWSA